MSGNTYPEPPKDLDWIPKFLEVFRKTGNASKAAESAGVSRKCPYQHKTRSAEFAEQWAEAEQAHIDDLEEIGKRRARWGRRRRTVNDEGKEVVVEDKASDRLMEFFLKGNRPEKYGNLRDIEEIVRRIVHEENVGQHPSGDRNDSPQGGSGETCDADGA